MKIYFPELKERLEDFLSIFRNNETVKSSEISIQREYQNLQEFYTLSNSITINCDEESFIALNHVILKVYKL